MADWNEDDDDSCTIWLRELGLDLTRENWIDLAFLGEGLPEGFDETRMPAPFRLTEPTPDAE